MTTENKKDPFVAPEGSRKYYLYVLLLEDDHYYVGVTSQLPENRFQQHLDGKGSKWTRKHKPISISEVKYLGFITYTQAENKENIETIARMRDIGIDKVRGGKYCRIVPSKKFFTAVKYSQKRLDKRNKKKTHSKKESSGNRAKKELDRSARLLGVYN